MEYQRINKSSSWNPPIQKKSSQFTPRPFSVQRKQGQPTQQDIENEVFSQNKFEAFGLQLKEKNGTITPVEQERLGVLQAKMDDFWAQRREQASARPSILDKMAANIQRREITQPSVTIQPKLTIGQPNDQYEQEADQVAAQVVEQINTPASNKSQGASVQRHEMTEEEVAQMKPEISTRQRKDISSADEVQTKLDTVMVQREGAEGGALSADLEGEINDSRGAGQSLAPNLQAKMGQAMGADFSGVRVHTDARADMLNRSVRARAFTTGQDLFFKQGEYQPGSRGGQELIAHELTHVVQQNGGVVRRKITKGEGGQEFDSIERRLNEFSEAYRAKISANEQLEQSLKKWVLDEDSHSISDVMNTIQEAIGTITAQECADILFDPVANQWVVPDDMDVWNRFITGYEKSKGKMKQSYAEYAEKAEKKAEKEQESKIPIDIEDEEQLRSLWGSESGINKQERVTAIVKMFEDSGYQVQNIIESTRSSSSTPPMLFDIVNHPTIVKFEIHPGGGIHAAPYIRISTQKGMIKVINKNSYPPYNKLTELNVTYVEVSK